MTAGSTSDHPVPDSTEVFLSYKREDRGRVEPIVHGLRSIGLSVWFDAALEAGETFDEEIARELAAARAHIVCWSGAAVKSRWVRSEAHVGADRGILVPVFLERCTPLPPFNLDHTIDLASWVGNYDHSGWGSVLSRIGTLLGRGAALHQWNIARNSSDLTIITSFVKSFAGDALAIQARRLAFQVGVQQFRSRFASELNIPNEDLTVVGEVSSLKSELRRASEELKQCMSARDNLAVDLETLRNAHADRLKALNVAGANERELKTEIGLLRQEVSAARHAVLTRRLFLAVTAVLVGGSSAFIAYISTTAYSQARSARLIKQSDTTVPPTLDAQPVAHSSATALGSSVLKTDSPASSATPTPSQPSTVAALQETTPKTKSQDLAHDKPLPSRQSKPSSTQGPLPAPARILSNPAPALSPILSAPAPAAIDPYEYFAQTGAYTNSDDAVQQREKLAQIGYSAKVLEREQGGRTVYRVRLGPFTTRDAVDTIQVQLATKGIEANIVRVDRPARPGSP